MPKVDDPYYNRKPIPDEFVKDVGYTGLTPQEEFYNRERKYSDQNGVDVRKFGVNNKSGFKPQADPYYGRRRVSKAEIDGVGETGLTQDEEYLNRERKYSVNGVDIRKFSTSATGGLEPQADPYYGRKSVSSKLTKGIGETGQTDAEAFEVRERKQSVVNFSSDPFQLLTGTGHRQSVSGPTVAGAAAAATRRRSSAAPISGMPGHTQHHSGYDGDNRLAPIESRPDPTGLLPRATPIALPPATGPDMMDDGIHLKSEGTGASASTNGAPHTTTTTTTTTTSTAAPVQQQYDDPDSVAPDERR